MDVWDLAALRGQHEDITIDNFVQKAPDLNPAGSDKSKVIGGDVLCDFVSVAQKPPKAARTRSDNVEILFSTSVAQPEPTAAIPEPESESAPVSAAVAAPTTTNEVNMPDVDADADDAPNETVFPPESQSKRTAHITSKRSIPVPPHRFTPLKRDWSKIFTALVEHLHLQVRMRTHTRSIDLRTSRKTTSADALQRGADFVQAYCLGFELDDAIALLRLDDLYIQTFEIKDVKALEGEHLSRAIGRIAGKDGRTKFAIENATRTRVVLADQKVHILGAYKNVNMAKTAVVNLILGKMPGKVHGDLQKISARLKQRF
ncbi:eukaryotic type KH-domain (KH-domain type I) [Piedraia hortae CBS 480.64]|uniref:Pre-rRNA-processing protein PNO1 n=1 Tax=Piedraia hortae CBS 480.64 TaxID=1314780 RepID=A0A6A7C8S6_9PEZI|nr:eukaryotic type KH-domain (KH-domain type I) [Piedraia hortae CBS 480.64]